MSAANAYVCTMESTTVRPGLKDVAAKVAKTMLPEFSIWCGAGEKNEADLLECLTKTFERYGDDDGYVIARQLEDDFGTESDEELVSIMSKVEIEVEAEIAKLTKEWVIQNGILPAFAIGDQVSAKYGLRTIVGKVKKIDMDRATYSLETEENDGWPTIKFEHVKPFELVKPPITVAS